MRFCTQTKWLGLGFLLAALPLDAQVNPQPPRPVIVNSGIASGMLEAHRDNSHFYGVVGQATSVVVAKDPHAIVHHGILHPLILSAIPIRVSEVSVYPNPTNGPFSVLWSREDGQPEWVEIINANGSPVGILPFANALSMENLPAGPYSLRFITGKTLLGVAEIILTR